MTSSRPLWLAVLIGASSLHLSCRSDVGSSQYRLTEAGFRVLYMAPVYVAMEKGFFERENIDFSFVEIQSGALGLATVISGQAQISDIDPLSIARLREQGQLLVMFYNLVNGVTLDLIVHNDVIERSGIRDSATLEERCRILEGLRIGITRPGAPTDVFARYFLTRGGLDPDRDATLVQVGGVASLNAAFRDGRIDAFLLSPPLPQSLEQDGIGKILVRNTAGVVPELARTSLVNLFTTREFAEANRPALEAYGRALRAATRWMRGNPEESVDVLRATFFSDTSSEHLTMALDTLLPSFNDDGRFGREDVQRYFDVFARLGEAVTGDSSEGVLWTNDFLVEPAEEGIEYGAGR